MIDKLKLVEDEVVADGYIDSNGKYSFKKEKVYCLPPAKEMFDKINEIIDYINGRKED